eukprot:2342567-Amphidinium_carterae.1
MKLLEHMHNTTFHNNFGWCVCACTRSRARSTSLRLLRLDFPCAVRARDGSPHAHHLQVLRAAASAKRNFLATNFTITKKRSAIAIRKIAQEKRVQLNRAHHWSRGRRYCRPRASPENKYYLAPVHQGARLQDRFSLPR